MNRVREVWARGQVAVGSFLTVPSPRFAEAFGTIGYDWILVDQQHGAVPHEGLLSLFHALELSQSTIVVRVGENDLIGVSRALDLGAHGIVAPMVSAQDSAEALVAAMRYPPLGDRSLGRTRRYAGPAEANDDILCIPMIETPDAVANAADIAGVDGVDALLLGPTDLALRLGVTMDSQAGSRAVFDMFGSVVEACRATGRAAGYVAMTQEEASTAIEAGASFVAYRSDLAILTAAGKADLAFMASLRQSGRDATPPGQ